MSQYMPKTAISSEPDSTPRGSAAHGGSPTTRSENSPRRCSSLMRPLRCPSTSQNMAAVMIIEPTVPPTTWLSSPPPAGGEPVPPCASTPITSPYHETRDDVSRTWSALGDRRPGPRAVARLQNRSRLEPDVQVPRIDRLQSRGHALHAADGLPRVAAVGRHGDRARGVGAVEPVPRGPRVAGAGGAGERAPVVTAVL